MSDKGQELLDAVPPYYENDPYARAVLDTLGREVQRAEDFAEHLATKCTPAQADDTYRILELWERILGLPPAPSGVSQAARRAKVVASFRRRKSPAGSDWKLTLTDAIGTSDWTYAEQTPGDYQLTITVPFAANTYQLEATRTIARRITPAHVQVIVSSGTGFIVGVSQVGVDPL